MNTEINEVEINGVKYIRKDASQIMAQSSDGLPCVIVGAGIGGIHFGFLKSKTGCEVTLINARRIQYWNGAASISEMAARGVSKPKDCRFSMAVPEITLTQVVEIVPVVTSAQKNLMEVPVWTR